MNRKKAELKHVLTRSHQQSQDGYRRQAASLATTMTSMQTASNNSSKQNIRRLERNDDQQGQQDQAIDEEDDFKNKSNQQFFRKTTNGYLNKSRGMDNLGSSFGGAGSISAVTANTAFHSRIQGGSSLINPSFQSIEQHVNEQAGSSLQSSLAKIGGQKRILNLSQQSVPQSHSVISPLSSPAKTIPKSSQSSKLNELLLQTNYVPATSNMSSNMSSYIVSPFKAGVGGQVQQNKWIAIGANDKEVKLLQNSQFTYDNSSSQVLIANSTPINQNIIARATTGATISNSKQTNNNFRRRKSDQFKGFGSLDQKSIQALTTNVKLNNTLHQRVQSQKRLPSSGLIDFPSTMNFEEIVENFKESMGLLDKCEMKKLQLQNISHTTYLSDYQKKEKKPEFIFKPNIATLEQKLVEGRTNWVELGMNEFTYFCVRVKGQSSPLRVRINQDKAFNFNVLVSREYQMPSQFNCDFKLQGNLFTFESDSNPENFTTQEFFYFAIFSNQESMIRIHISFGAYYDYSKSKKNNKTINQNQTEASKFGAETGVIPANNSEVVNLINAHSNRTVIPIKSKSNLDLKTKVQELTNNQLKLQVQYIIEKRRLRMGGGGIAPNMIQKNIENLQTQNLEEVIRAKFNLKHIKSAKIQHVQEQRDLLFESHIATIQSKKDDKQYKKYEKIQTKMQEIRSFQKKSFDFFWISAIILTIAAEKMTSRLQKHKERQRIMRDMAFSLLRPFFKYKTRARKIGGENIHVRCLLDSKFVVQDYAKIKKKQVVPQAEMVIASILEQNKERFLMIEKVVRYITYGKWVVQQLAGFRLKVINYKKLLFRYWDKYYGEIIAQILEVKIDTNMKDPSLAKRQAQNVLLSFNHLDHKRHAIEAHYKLALSKYLMLLKEAKLIHSEPQSPKSPISFMITTNSVHSGVQSPIINEVADDKDNSSEKSQEQIQKPKFIYPRLFALPSKEDLKKIIFNAAVAVSKNYPELQKKVNFK